MLLRFTSFEKAISEVKSPNSLRLVTSAQDVSCIKLHLVSFFDSLLLSIIGLLSKRCTDFTETRGVVLVLDAILERLGMQK